MKKFLILVILILVGFSVHIFDALAFVSSDTGNYLELNGGYVQAGNIPVKNPASLTFEFWAKPKNVVGKQYILSIGNMDTAMFNYEIGLNGNSVFLNHRFSSGGVRYITTNHVEKNKWNHIGVVLGNEYTIIYVNGKANTTFSGISSIAPIGEDIIIGKKINLSSSYSYYGDLDELRVSTSVRDVKSLYESNAYNSSLLPDTNTYLLYNFNQNRGETTVHDFSGNDISGILTGGDYKIRFWGAIPTPSKYILPTLPSLSRDWIFHRIDPTPNDYNPGPDLSPTPIDIRFDRPVYRR